MRTWSIPVEWTVTRRYTDRADTLEEAIQEAEING
jgi:hypothetical protein